MSNIQINTWLQDAIETFLENLAKEDAKKHKQYRDQHISTSIENHFDYIEINWRFYENTRDYYGITGSVLYKPHEALRLFLEQKDESE